MHCRATLAFDYPTLTITALAARSVYFSQNPNPEATTSPVALFLVLERALVKAREFIQRCSIGG